MTNGKFVFIDIDEHELPVFIRVKSSRFKSIYYAVLKNRNGLFVKKADKEFLQKKEQLITECYDNFCSEKINKKDST